MARYVAVRTGEVGARDTRFYVVDTGLDSSGTVGAAVMTCESWHDAVRTAADLHNETELDNGRNVPMRAAYCRQCESTLCVDALTAECGVCGSRYIGTMGGAQ